MSTEEVNKIMKQCMKPKALVVQQEVPVDGGLWAPFHAPSEHALAGLLAFRLWYSPINVPHAERHLARGIDENFVFLLAGDGEPLVLVLGKLIGHVDVRVVVVVVRQCGLEGGDDGWPPRLREMDVLHDSVLESCREPHSFAVR